MVMYGGLEGLTMRVEDLDERIIPMLKTDLKAWEMEGTVHPTSRFLGALVYGDVVSDGDLQRFAKVIDYLVDEGIFQKRRLACVIGLPLAPIPKTPQRWALFLYGYSVWSMEDINRKLGMPMIIGEGDLPDEGWPTWLEL